MGLLGSREQRYSFQYEVLMAHLKMRCSTSVHYIYLKFSQWVRLGIFSPWTENHSSNICLSQFWSLIGRLGKTIINRVGVKSQFPFHSACIICTSQSISQWILTSRQPHTSGWITHSKIFFTSSEHVTTTSKNQPSVYQSMRCNTSFGTYLYTI